MPRLQVKPFENAPTAEVWVESKPKYGPQRRAIIDAADRGGLDSAWVRQLVTWQALRVAHPANDFTFGLTAHARARGWDAASGPASSA